MQIAIHAVCISDTADARAARVEPRKMVHATRHAQVLTMPQRVAMLALCTIDATVAKVARVEPKEDGPCNLLCGWVTPMPKRVATLAWGMNVAADAKG